VRLKKMLACEIDRPQWREFRHTLEYAVAHEDNADPMIDNALRDYLSDRTRSVKEVLQCNVGVVAMYYHLAKRVLRFRPYDLERAYGLLQLSMIFIFTLRNAVTVPPVPAREWRVTERDVIGSIRMMKPTIDARRHADRVDRRPMKVADNYRNPDLRIAVVSICAYPDDHPIALKHLTPGNRALYAERHGYTNAMHFEHPIIGGNVHVQHSKLALVAHYAESGEYDWIAWFDCDSLIMNMDKTLDSIIYKYVQGARPAPPAAATPDAEWSMTNLTGLWADSFAGPGAVPDIRVWEDSEGALRAEAPQFGVVDEGARVADQVVLHITVEHLLNLLPDLRVQDLPVQHPTTNHDLLGRSEQHAVDACAGEVMCTLIPNRVVVREVLEPRRVIEPRPGLQC